MVKVLRKILLNIEHFSNYEALVQLADVAVNGLDAVEGFDQIDLNDLQDRGGHWAFFWVF